PEQHSIASSFQIFFSGFGLILALTVGALLFKSSNGYPFFLAATMVLATASWTFAVMRKESLSHSHLDAGDEGLLEFLRGERNLRWLFGAQFCWWFAIQAASTFAVLFTVHDIKGIHDIASPEGKRAA